MTPDSYFEIIVYGTACVVNGEMLLFRCPTIYSPARRFSSETSFARNRLPKIAPLASLSGTQSVRACGNPGALAPSVCKRGWAAFNYF
ncbi:MAG: hypothetical protein U9Q82_13895 [Chloroflexota bacterium]|nr:hypothetical protein [Chloroflexota bacterium]